MGNLDISSDLLSLIGKVTMAPDERAASMELLFPLLCLFDMDQAALCETNNNQVHPTFAVDRTRRIISAGQQLWLSTTLMQTALENMAPAVYHEELQIEDGIPKSIDENSLRNIVCIPISQETRQVIYLASQRKPLRHFSEEELRNFKIASQAAVLALQQHRSFRKIREQNEKLETALRRQEGTYLYASSKIGELLKEISRVAPFNISIVLLGESGVGKEVLAKEIHRLSGRKGSFVAINCANLTETLLESELFGHSRGAFTGATHPKIGMFQEADEGTFLLDEIAELSLNLQAKLLRVLQEKSIRPLGATKDITVNVRILAASHRDLKVAVSENRFREDLYYRLQEITFLIPPLRDRVEDIELLAHRFVSKFASEFQMPERKLSPEAIDKLLSYPWPGNIRELQNICRTSVILSQKTNIEVDDIRISSPATTSSTQSQLKGEDDETLKELSQRYERDLITSMLQEPGQTKSSVAKKLGISVRTLQRAVFQT